jgi:hypothetical protein
LVSFYLIQLSKQLLVLNLYPNTSVYSAAGYDPNGIIDYYGTLSRAGEHNGCNCQSKRACSSYSVPNSTIDKIGLTSLRFGVNARNPFTVLAKKQQGYTDPEASSSTANNGNGIGYSGTGQYPNTRTFGGSINLTF